MFEPLHILLNRQGHFLVRKNHRRSRTYFVYKDVDNSVSGYKHMGLAETFQIYHESVLEFTTPNSITLTQKCGGRYLKPSLREYV
jgi:hypothetical protein